MAIPGGLQQERTAKKREATRPATSDGDGKKRSDEPLQPRAAKSAATDHEAKKRTTAQEAATADHGAMKESVLAQEASAADRSAKKPSVLAQEHVAADHGAKKEFVLAQDAAVAARPAVTHCPAKKQPELAQEAGAKKQGPVQAAVIRSFPNCSEPKKSPELIQANDAAPSCYNWSAPHGGKAKESEAEDANNCTAPNAAASSSDSQADANIISGKKRGEKELQWLLLQRRQEELEPDFFWKKTSLLSRLFECCGLIDLVNDKDSKVLHVSEKKILVSQSKSHYNINGSAADKLYKSYSSFRLVLGDGECFYRSFIFSYLELVLANDDTFEENRLLCAIEKVSSSCLGLEWLYGDYNKHCKEFKQLLERVKSWKIKTREVRMKLLLTYFADYKKTEAILAFLRFACAAWILTHPEFSAFHPIEDGATLEEYCRLEIIQSRSFADNLAIAALADAFGIQIRIFSLENGNTQDMCGSHSGESTGVPTVSLLYTGIHYDILYPR